MTSANPEMQTLIDAMRHYAAMNDGFDPATALRQVAGEDAFSDQVLMVEVLSALRPDCTIEPGKDGDLWLMRPGARRKILSSIQPETAATAPETPDQPSAFKTAVAGEGSFAPDEIDRLIEETSDPEVLTALAVTLDRAGPKAPGFGKLIAVRSALNQARQVRRTDEALAAGFFGREDELETLEAWINAPQDRAPLQTAHVSGLPGIGKSFLFERAIQQARRGSDPILVRLDFDRSGLQVLDPYALFEEISRQVGDNLPAAAAELRALRLKSAEEVAALGGTSQRQGFPRELLRAIAGAVGDSGRDMLLVLDTLEVLRSEGETHVMTLFDQLDLLVEFGVGRISVVSAGRGEAIGPVTDRIARSIPLRGLETPEAQALLERRGVAREIWQRVLRLARGNPLLLTLAAKAMEDEEFDETELPGNARDEAIAGYLYRAILSRVPKALRGVANQGLILRRINKAALMAIVAPALGLSLDEANAAKMLDALVKQHWLVDFDQGWVQHRPDMRSAILDLIYQAHPHDTAEIDRRSEKWFARSDPLTALYHRLQLTRSGAALPSVSAELARDFTDPMIADLPPRARDAVRQARGQRSGFGRPADETAAAGASPDKAVVGARRMASRDVGSARAAPNQVPHLRYDPAARRIVFVEIGANDSYPPPDERAVRDLELMLGKGALREASYVLANGFDMPFAGDGAAAPVVLAHQWQTGQWAVAERMLRLMTRRSLDWCLNQSAYLLGRTMLELWAEFRFDELVTRLDDAGFYERAALLLRESAHLGLNGGALDFALICAAPADAPAGTFSDGLSALAPSMPQGEAETAFDALKRAENWRASMELSLPGLDPTAQRQTPDLMAEALAPLNPYAGPIQAHVSAAEDANGGAVLDYLEALRPALPEAAARFMPRLDGVSSLNGRLASNPSDVAQALSAMGLAAEWSEGFTFYRPVPDLPTIANAAERWRRTVNGLWSYGRRRPPGWQGAGDTDWASAALVDRLMSAPDPEAEARRTLRFWADPGDADPTFGRRQARRRLLHRYLAAMETTNADPMPVLAAFQKADVPGTLAAPLAVLAVLGVHPDQALPGGDPD